MKAPPFRQSMSRDPPLEATGDIEATGDRGVLPLSSSGTARLPRLPPNQSSWQGVAVGNGSGNGSDHKITTRSRCGGQVPATSRYIKVQGLRINGLRINVAHATDINTIELLIKGYSSNKANANKINIKQVTRARGVLLEVLIWTPAKNPAALQSPHYDGFNAGGILIFCRRDGKIYELFKNAKNGTVAALDDRLKDIASGTASRINNTPVSGDDTEGDHRLDSIMEEAEGVSDISKEDAEMVEAGINHVAPESKVSKLLQTLDPVVYRGDKVPFLEIDDVNDKMQILSDVFKLDGGTATRYTTPRNGEQRLLLLLFPKSKISRDPRDASFLFYGLTSGRSSNLMLTLVSMARLDDAYKPAGRWGPIFDLNGLQKTINSHGKVRWKFDGKNLTQVGKVSGSPNPILAFGIVKLMEAAGEVKSVTQDPTLPCGQFYHGAATYDHAAHPTLELVYRSLHFTPADSTNGQHFVLHNPEEAIKALALMEIAEGDR